jgi:hypothetical protein
MMSHDSFTNAQSSSGVQRKLEHLRRMTYDVQSEHAFTTMRINSRAGISNNDSGSDQFKLPFLDTS